MIRVTKKSKVKKQGSTSLSQRADHASSKRMGPYKHKTLGLEGEVSLNNAFIYSRPAKENICAATKETQSEIKPF